MLDYAHHHQYAVAFYFGFQVEQPSNHVVETQLACKLGINPMIAWLILLAGIIDIEIYPWQNVQFASKLVLRAKWT